MESKEMICIICPTGCHLEVIADPTIDTGYIVKGAICKRGEVYGIKELTNPTRIITTTVKLNGGLLRRLPVRTDTDISKDKIFECMKIINAIEVQVPVKIGQVIVENILGTGVNIVASRSMD